MANPVEFMLADLREKYEAMPSSGAFDRLYDDPEWSHMFAVLHKRLNEHFTDINGSSRDNSPLLGRQQQRPPLAHPGDRGRPPHPEASRRGR